MFFGAQSFNQTLCWDLPDSAVDSYAVFCESNGTFHKKCIDKDRLEKAEARCIKPVDAYLKSFTDYFNDICEAFEDIGELFSECFGGGTG